MLLLLMVTLLVMVLLTISLEEASPAGNCTVRSLLVYKNSDINLLSYLVEQQIDVLSYIICCGAIILDSLQLIEELRPR